MHVLPKLRRYVLNCNAKSASLGVICKEVFVGYSSGCTLFM